MCLRVAKPGPSVAPSRRDPWSGVAGLYLRGGIVLFQAKGLVFPSEHGRGVHWVKHHFTCWRVEGDNQARRERTGRC